MSFHRTPFIVFLLHFLNYYEEVTLSSPHTTTTFLLPLSFSISVTFWKQPGLVMKSCREYLSTHTQMHTVVCT